MPEKIGDGPHWGPWLSSSLLLFLRAGYGTLCDTDTTGLSFPQTANLAISPLEALWRPQHGLSQSPSCYHSSTNNDVCKKITVSWHVNSPNFIILPFHKADRFRLILPLLAFPSLYFPPARLLPSSLAEMSQIFPEQKIGIAGKKSTLGTIKKKKKDA